MKTPMEYALDVRHGLMDEFSEGGWPSEYTDRVGVVIDRLVVTAIEEAVSFERDACAKMAEGGVRPWPRKPFDQGLYGGRHNAAELIRGRNAK